MDDLISRKDAIKYMANTIWHYPNHTELNVYENAEELAKDGLTNIPSAESTSAITEAFGMTIEALKAQEWIPCSKRLPSDSGNYLITGADFRLGYIGERIVTTADFYAKAKKWNSIVDVIAWMPLPEPYREKGE